MSNKLSCSALFYGVSAASLSAQAPTSFSAAQIEQSALSETVVSLTQSGFIVLLGAIVLAAVIFLYLVCKGCTDLKKQQPSGHRTFPLMLVWGTVLSVLGSSCTAAQHSRALDIQAAQAAESPACPMAHHRMLEGTIGLHIPTVSSGYNQHHGPVFCKQCGQRIIRVKY